MRRRRMRPHLRFSGLRNDPYGKLMAKGSKLLYGRSRNRSCTTTVEDFVLLLLLMLAALAAWLAASVRRPSACWNSCCFRGASQACGAGLSVSLFGCHLVSLRVKSCDTVDHECVHD